MSETIIENAEKAILFSSLSGYNFYTLDPKKKPSGFYCGKHCISGEEVEIRFSDQPRWINGWRNIIEYPADSEFYLWPVDVVSYFDGTNQKQGLVFQRQSFPAKSFPQLEPLKKFLYTDELLDWRTEPVKRFLYHFLDCAIHLNNGGYAYFDYNLDRIYYNPQDMNVLFDFTPYITRLDGDRYRSEKIPGADVAIEFLAPWVPAEGTVQVDLICEYYAIAAILFRAMIGRMPYQGRQMDGHGNIMNLLTDTDAMLHRQMFLVYRSNPRFIFEPGQHENTIGQFDNEKKYKERWKALPEQIQTMMMQVLCMKNAKADNLDRVVYSPQEWMEAFSRYIFV